MDVVDALMHALKAVGIVAHNAIKMHVVALKTAGKIVDYYKCKNIPVTANFNVSDNALSM